MNVYAKYCPNVWLAHTQEEHQKGDVVSVANKYGKESDCEIHNLILRNSKGYYYSVTRCDGLNRQTYAERKAEKYERWALSAHLKSNKAWDESNEGREFLSLAEPIKIGHHSEKRHRALIQRNHDKSHQLSIAAKDHGLKAAYWESRKNDIDLSMPESIEYFTFELEKAEKLQSGLKDGSIEKSHSYSLSYATKDVKTLKSKLVDAVKLWG
jgi:hypothetical protein